LKEPTNRSHPTPKCRRESDLGLCTTSGLAKRMLLHGADFRFKNVFGRKIDRKSALRSGIPFASPEVVHRPRSNSLLHFDSQTYTIFVWKKYMLALGVCFRSPTRAVAAGLPRQDHVYITTDESFSFHNNEFDDMPCELDSTENPRSFEKCPTPSQFYIMYPCVWIL